MKHLASILLFVGLLPGSASAQDNPVQGFILRENLYTMDAASTRVYRMGPSRTERREVGFFPLGPCGSLALGPDGMLYTLYLNTKTLFRMDPSDGSTTTIGQLQLNGTLWEGGLTISPSGQAYGANLARSYLGKTQTWLFSIDLTTGKGTDIGMMGVYEINGLAWRSDGKLVGVDRWSNSLVRINPNTGNTSMLAPMPVPAGSSGGLAITGQHGYFITGGALTGDPGTHELWHFDPFTGASTWMQALPHRFYGSGFNALSPARMPTSLLAPSVHVGSSGWHPMGEVRRSLARLSNRAAASLSSLP